MTSAKRKGLAGPLGVVAVLIVTAATLRYAQDFFLPLVFSGLLSFLLSPLVGRLERWGLGRVGAVLVTAAMAFVLIGGLTYLVTSQFLDLAASLPKYRDNLIARVASLKLRGDNSLSRAGQTISEVKEALTKSDGESTEKKPESEPAEPKPEKPAADVQPEAKKPPTKTAAESAGKKPGNESAEPKLTKPASDTPVRVAIADTTDSSLHMLLSLITPLVGPLGNALVIIVIVIFMLVAGADLRDRLIHLIGRGRLRVTTEALDELAYRISAYLRAQVIVNASFGLAVAIGLSFIGIQNAVFWGLLGMVLRFLPYIGAWIAAAFPIALSIAMYQSWTQPLLTIALFVAVELLVSNVVEPWLYGASTEISPLAVVVSALFWTWLWGGVGLVLATPMTVCLAVAGKYLPDLAFLDLLMGDKPSIAPGDRLYQRLLALNEEEAAEIVEEYAKENSILAAFDEVALPALRSVETDFRAGELSDSARGEACQILRQIIAEIAPPGGEVTPQAEGADEAISVLFVPASHEADELAAFMLAQALSPTRAAIPVLSSKLLAGEAVEQVVALAPRIVCISVVPPASIIAARALCGRLRAQLPSARILVGLWQAEDADFAIRRERLARAGADATYADLRSCAADISEFALCSALPEAALPAAG